MSIVELKGIYTAYEGGDKAVIRDLSLHVERGEYVVIGGPNSAGKTTLLESINGLVKITHGSATVCGLDISRFSEEESGLAIGRSPTTGGRGKGGQWRSVAILRVRILLVNKAFVFRSKII